MMLQACLNGGRPVGFHERLPLTPEQLAADAQAVHAAGAAELHIHPRGLHGRESLSAEAVGATLQAVRAAVPGMPVGVSTGAWIEADNRRRLDCIRGWKILPDYASVNLSEADAPAVIETLLAKGVGIEAGLATPANADRLIEIGAAERCLRILIEIADSPAEEAIAVALEVERRLRAASIIRPILLHGFDRSVWPLFELASRRGHDSRLGLEDGRQLPDGRIADSNAALIMAGVAIAKEFGGQRDFSWARRQDQS